MPGYILAIDQGTTSSRAIVFDRKLTPRAVAQKEFRQHFPRSGWVEHEPEDIWTTVVAVCRAALRKARLRPTAISAIGITNQRETTLVWDRRTGKPIHRAIVWQDRRTADMCQRLKAEGHEALFARKTGLLLDPYFSGTKLAWLLDAVPGARARAERGELCFGTVDSFLIWRLTGGRVHATDATNASRTLLYDIHQGAWDEDLCRLLRVPMALLPEVKDCAADYGITDKKLLGAAIPLLGVAGDPQAAA
ncbi:MAG TPA: FGGY family carbohydrate kinase, partial [Aestuariivirga sp.]|nr:FGGY family carbohydrate kinase [Aestuariivirga sp.]